MRRVIFSFGRADYQLRHADTNPEGVTVRRKYINGLPCGGTEAAHENVEDGKNQSP
jgi:hypothetical protein